MTGLETICRTTIRWAPYHNTVNHHSNPFKISPTDNFLNSPTVSRPSVEIRSATETIATDPTTIDRCISISKTLRIEHKNAELCTKCGRK